MNHLLKNAFFLYKKLMRIQLHVAEYLLIIKVRSELSDYHGENMSKDKRIQRRRHLIYYLKVVFPETGESIGRLVDITPVGMMIISEKPLETGQEIPVRIIFPSVLAANTCLDMVGETVWCHLDVNPDYYAVGFRFNSPTEESALLVKDLVDSFGFRD